MTKRDHISVYYFEASPFIPAIITRNGGIIILAPPMVLSAAVQAFGQEWHSYNWISQQIQPFMHEAMNAPIIGVLLDRDNGWVSG